MFFTHLCRAAAVLGIALSAGGFLAAYIYIDGFLTPTEMTRWLAQWSLRFLVVGIVLGTLAEISFSLRKGRW